MMHTVDPEQRRQTTAACHLVWVGPTCTKEGGASMLSTQICAAVGSCQAGLPGRHEGVHAEVADYRAAPSTEAESHTAVCWVTDESTAQADQLIVDSTCQPI